MKESYFEHIPIDESVLTEEYFHSSSDMDATMSQVININTQMSSEDEDCIFSFMRTQIRHLKKKKRNFYSQLKPNFTEVVNWISTRQEVHEFYKLMDSFVSDI